MLTVTRQYKHFARGHTTAQVTFRSDRKIIGTTHAVAHASMQPSTEGQNGPRGDLSMGSRRAASNFTFTGCRGRLGKLASSSGAASRG
jgi:hypothetical protein